MVFLPWEYPTLMLNFETFITVFSSIYSKCQAQEMFDTFKEMLTYQGMSDLSARLSMGASSEIPFLYTKMSQSDRACI